MRRAAVFALVLAVGVVFGLLADRTLLNAQPSSASKILLKHDVTGFEGREGIIVETTIPVGGESKWHHHPGGAYTYILSGESTLDIKGQQTIPRKTGDVSYIEGYVPHNAKNTGTTPLKILTVYVAEKGKPLTTYENP